MSVSTACVQSLEFELRGNYKFLCEFAGFVLGALRFFYSVGSKNYVSQKSVSIALNQKFALERSENGKLIFSVPLVLCGCVRYENLHEELKARIFQHCN